MKAYIMGNYTEKAFQGFLKDPNTDRKAVVEADSFTNVAAIKLAVEASGSISNMTICEAIDIKSAAEMAGKVASVYKPAG